MQHMWPSSLAICMAKIGYYNLTETSDLPILIERSVLSKDSTTKIGLTWLKTFLIKLKQDMFSLKRMLYLNVAQRNCCTLIGCQTGPQVFSE